MLFFAFPDDDSPENESTENQNPTPTPAQNTKPKQVLTADDNVSLDLTDLPNFDPDKPDTASSDTINLDNEPQPTEESLSTPDKADTSDKVDLDLEDAPFLERPKEAPKVAIDDEDLDSPNLKEKEQSKNTDSEVSDKKKSKKKLLIIIFSTQFLLILLAAGLFAMFHFSEREVDLSLTDDFTTLSEDEIPGEEDKEKDKLEGGEKDGLSESEDPPMNEKDYAPEVLTNIYLKPFFIARQFPKEKSTRFFELHIVLSTKKNIAKDLIIVENISLRNAIYVFLSRKDVEFLLDPNQRDILKQELLQIINKYMAGHSFETILFAKYLVR